MKSNLQPSRSSRPIPAIVIFSAASLALVFACATGDQRDVGDDPRNDGGGLLSGEASVIGSEDASFTNKDFFVNDPPPKWCGPDAGTTPATPGGTPACPTDKNLEGCPCAKEGATAACWPGYRKNRGLGICEDGKTTCVTGSEGLQRVWGKCQGAVMPTAGVTQGKEACACFSAGEWKIANLSPCFVTQGTTLGVSTLSSTGQCPTSTAFPPKPPAGYWSKNTLTVDCAGHFQLCYTLKAGTAKAPSASDCTVASVCTEADYTKAGTPQDLPVLPSWVSSDAACSAKFDVNGGYGEMTVKGLSVQCDDISDNGKAYVFSRVDYCPKICNSTPTAPECAQCQAGGGGSF